MAELGKRRDLAIPLNVTGATCVQGWRAHGFHDRRRTLRFFSSVRARWKPRHRPRITDMTLFPTGCVKLRTVLLCRRYALRSRKCPRADLEATGMVAYHDLAALLESPHV